MRNSQNEIYIFIPRETPPDPILDDGALRLAPPSPPLTAINLCCYDLGSLARKTALGRGFRGMGMHPTSLKKKFTCVAKIQALECKANFINN